MSAGLLVFSSIGNSMYAVLADAVLALHLIFILWVIFGVLLSRGRPLLRAFHIACLGWGVLVELLPWPCPLTLLENWLEARAGVQPYQGGFLLHYLDATVYPNVSPALLTAVGVAVCGVNFGVYTWLLARAVARRQRRR